MRLSMIQFLLRIGSEISPTLPFDNTLQSPTIRDLGLTRGLAKCFRQNRQRSVWLCPVLQQRRIDPGADRLLQHRQRLLVAARRRFAQHPNQRKAKLRQNAVLWRKCNLNVVVIAQLGGFARRIDGRQNAALFVD